MFRKLGLIVVFLLLGWISTASVWLLCRAAVLSWAKSDFTELLTLVLGFAGPALAWIMVWRITRRASPSTRDLLRSTSAIGLGLALIVEVVLLTPLILLGVAFYGVRM